MYGVRYHNLFIGLLTCLLGLTLFGCRECRFGCESGRCIRGVCECNENWEGDACERFILSKYTGQYARLDTCISKRVDTVSLAVGDRSTNQMIWDGSMRLQFTSETDFYIPEQVYLSDTIIGAGQMLVDGISIGYESVSTVQMKTCLTEAVRVDPD